MPKLNVAKLKRELTAAAIKRFASTSISNPIKPSRQHRAANKLLAAYLQKSGLDTSKFNKLAAEEQVKRRQAIARQAAQLAKRSTANLKALRRGLKDQQKLIEFLGSHRHPPLAAPAIVLSKPFLIVQAPKFTPLLVDSTIEPLGSNIRIFLQSGGSDQTQFNFYFLWQNDSQQNAVVNVSTSLILNGHCYVDAAGGFFTGDQGYLIFTPSLALLQWWDQSNGGLSTPVSQQSQIGLIPNISVEGGALYRDSGNQPLNFENSTYNMSYEMFLVPPLSTAIFEVGLRVQYGFGEGQENVSDQVFIDLADKAANRFIMCPSVILQPLT